MSVGVLTKSLTVIPPPAVYRPPSFGPSMVMATLGSSLGGGLVPPVGLVRQGAYLM